MGKSYFDFISACEVIAEAISQIMDIKISGKEVYSSHPTGELFWIPDAYIDACEYLNKPCQLKKSPDGLMYSWEA